MPEEAAIVYEISVYAPAIQRELIGALELLLRQRAGSHCHEQAGAVSPNARELAERLFAAARREHEAMPGSIAVQFFDTGVKIAESEPIPYCKLTAMIETNMLYLLDFGESMVLLQKKDRIKGTALPTYLAEKTGLHPIQYH